MGSPLRRDEDFAPWVDAQPGGVGVLVGWSDPSRGALLASAGTDRTVRIWDAETGAPVGDVLIGHTAVVGALTCVTCTDGRVLLVSAGEDCTVRVWQTESGEPLGDPLIGHTGWVMALTSWIAPDGEPRVASASTDATIRIWDPIVGQQVGEPLAGHTAGLWALTSFVDSAGVVKLASGGDDGTIRLWRADTAEPVGNPIPADASGLYGLIVCETSNGATRLVAGGIDGKIRVWDPETGSAVGEPLKGHKAAVRSFASWRSPDGLTLVASASADGTIRIWDLDSQAAVGPARTGHYGWMPAVVSWTGADRATRLASAADGGVIRIWDPNSGADLVPPLLGHVAGIWALTSWIRPDGNARIASAGDDATIRIWNPDSGAAVGIPLRGHTAGVWSLTSWLDDGAARIASAGDDGTIRIWDPDSGASIGAPLAAEAAWIPALVSWVDAGIATLASGGIDGVIRIWDAGSGTLLHSLVGGHDGWILSLTSYVRADGVRMLASGGADATIRLWTVGTGALVGQPLTGHSAWVRSLTSWTRADGTVRIASGSFDGTVRIWDPEQGVQVGEPVVGHANRVGAVTSWLDSQAIARVASGSDDDTIRVWDPDSHGAVGPPLVGHTSGIWALTSWIGPTTGPRVASAGYDGTVRMWDPLGGTAVRTIEVGPVAIWGLSDAPTNRDLLGRQVLADAVADQLYRAVDSETTEDVGPTVVSIEGPWGSGKSTLMRMIRDRAPRATPAKPRRTRTFAVREAVRELRRFGHAMPSALTEAPPGGVVTAWFNPWAHQSGEQVWAGLVNELIDAAGPALYCSDADRERYWFARNLGRMDRFAIRRVLLRRTTSPLLGLALVSVAAPVLLAVAELNLSLKLLGESWSAINIAVVLTLAFLVSGTIHTLFRYRYGRVARYLPGEMFHLPMPEGILLSDKDQPERIDDPLRRARAGTLYLLQHDVAGMLSDLNRAGYSVVVFIDDLDRCRSETTAEVFEAINLFLSGLTANGQLKARFVVGLDPSVVAGHFDRYAVQEGATATPYADDRSPGWAFLRKLVQLPVLVPHVSDMGVRRFVETVTGIAAPPPVVARVRAPDVNEGNWAAPRPTPASSAQVPPAISVRRDSPAAGRRTRVETFAWKTLEQHPDVANYIVARLAAQPERSIREAKRMLNVWQLYERVSSQTEPLSRPADAVRRARHLVIVAEIVTRWPALQRSLHREISGRRVLESLADAVESDEQWRDCLRLLDPGENEQALNHLRQLLRDHDGQAVAAIASRLL